MIEPPLVDDEPSPYATKSWTYAQIVEEVDDDEECEADLPLYSYLESPSPYSTKAWTYHQTVVDIDDCESDEEETSSLQPDWWETIEGSGPSPYNSASWAYTQILIEEFDPNPVEAVADVELDWRETISAGGPSPYATASWAYLQEVTYVLEFVPVELKLFFSYDEEFYPRTKGFGTILDSGYFGQKGEAVYDSAYYFGEERGILMKRKLARIFVYDQLADSPGLLTSIPQPLGNLSTDPNFGDPLQTDPVGDEIGAELDSIYIASINADTGPEESLDIAGDGVEDGNLIEVARSSIPQDDRPPGTLLGSVSYELFENIVTITDWEHLNWQDDTPVYKAVKVILNELPDCVTEVKVLDPPHAFWTSLGFRPNFKGDQYLHLYTV